MAAYTTIDNPELYFQAKAYTGNGGTHAITFDNTDTSMQPDMVWLKKRNGTTNHHLVDVVRGVGRYLFPNLGNAEGGDGTGLLTAFNSNGFTLDGNADSNASGATGISWCWKTGGSASTNTSGSIDVELSASATSGVSVCTGTSASSGEFTFAHGLGTKVDMCIFKNRADAGTDWVVFQSSVCDATTKYMTLGTGALATNGSSIWGAALPTTTLMGGTSGQLVTGSKTFVAYNFSNRQGFLKCGKYVGNGSADPLSVNCGFKPSFIMIKESSSTGNWVIMDNKRINNSLADANNGNMLQLYANLTNADDTDPYIYATANGFVNINSNSDTNASGQTYIYIAMAESPFTNSNGVPNNAQ
jgi:hypothetical protein